MRRTAQRAEGGADVLWIETISAREELAAALAGCARVGLGVASALTTGSLMRTIRCGLLAYADAVQQADQLFLLLQIVEQDADPLQIGQAFPVLKQVGATPHDQGALAVRAAGPGGQAVLDQAGGGLVQFTPCDFQLLRHLAPGVGEGPAAQAGVQEVE